MAGDIIEAKRLFARAEAVAAANRLDLGEDGAVAVPPLPGPPDPANEARRRAAAAEAQALARRALQAAEAADQACSASLRSAAAEANLTGLADAGGLPGLTPAGWDLLAGFTPSPGQVPTGRDCAATLACTIDDFDRMSVAERRRFVDEFQRLYGEKFNSRGKWNSVAGVLHFFADDDLGASGTWVSLVDSSILNGFEQWQLYFGHPGQRPQRRGDPEGGGRPALEPWRAALDPQRRPGGGRRGTSPDLPAVSFALGGEAYRWILRNERAVEPFDDQVPLGREAFRDFTDPANPYPLARASDPAVITMESHHDPATPTPRPASQG